MTTTNGTALGVLRRSLDMAGTVATVALVIGWALFFRPMALHGPASYGLVSGNSMEPGMHTGDLVIAQRKDDYRRGDVIVYRIPGTGPEAGYRIIHRIVGGSAATGYRTQGDNREHPDLWRPKPADIDGEAWITAAGVGNILRRLRSDLGMALLAGILAFGIVGEPRRKAPKRAVPAGHDAGVPRQPSG
jgi:signal peptidase